MADEHIRKFSLRYYAPSADNRAIEDRVEIGVRLFMFSRTYQFDRGRWGPRGGGWHSVAGFSRAR